MISQLTKEEPHAGVREWLSRSFDADVYLSAVSVEEIRLGIELMPEGRKKRRLDDWLSNGILPGYGDHVLPITAEIAEACGRKIATEEKRGFHPDLSDAYITATALVHGLRLATLNRNDFARLGVEMVEF